MPKIIVTMWTTLDGFVAGPDDEMDWLRFDDDLQAYETDLVAAADTLLLGRITFNDFAGHWPNVARDPDSARPVREYAQALDALNKIVVSASGQVTNWARTSQWPTLDASRVQDLTSRPGGHVVVYGSLSVVDTLTALGLVDEYHLLVHPTVLRAGKAMLGSGPPLQLRTVGARTFSSGVTLMTYRPDGAAPA